MIDLHLHTTASDGLCTPELLVQQAAAAALTAMSVTDHDTTAAVVRTSMLCEAAGITLVPGIEITAIESEHDVHVLGYFIRPDHDGLQAFLARSRSSRMERVRAIAARLASLGAPIDLAPLFREAAAQEARTIGRPQIARALIAAGHAVDTNDAFEKWLARGRPAFLPRSGASPEQVIAIIHDAGGLASLAHPVLARMDDRIPQLVDNGLDAIEVYHSDHDDAARSHYRAMADRLHLLATGGSDYHGDPAHGLAPGSVTLPVRDWERLSAWPRRSSH